MNRVVPWLTALCLACALGSLLLAGGIAIRLADPSFPVRPATIPGDALLAGLAGAGALAVAAFAIRRAKRLFFHYLVLFSLLGVVTVGAGEGVARFYAPPWPARALHGIAPAVSGPWASRSTWHPEAIGVNSWGERDNERTIAPPAGRRRIVFIGDSLLEESSVVPLPLAVERALGRADLETVNLAVSATAPDEYFWRLRSVGFELRPAHVVVVVYAGNDFGPGPTLPTLAGISAPEPKPSVLASLGLSGLNHFAAGSRRPLMRIWRGSGDLQRQEEEVHALIRGTDDAGMPGLLAEVVDPPLRPALVAHLESGDRRAFYAGLREPDAGLYRSYYLVNALNQIPPLFAGPPAADPGWVRYVLSLIVRMDADCRGRGVAFTLAIAPEASQVDPRFAGYWGSISRLPESKSSTTVMSRQLAEGAAARGIAVVDLGDVLRGVGGAYYNLDGHWSEIGVGVAAGALARHLADWADAQ